MKTLMLMACMAVSSVAAAQDTVYDYQGAVMTGVGGPETITAQLDLIGPVSDLTFNVSVSIAGSSYSTQFPANGCSVVCSSAGSPMSFQFNEKNGKFVGADLTMANLPGPPYDNELLGVLSIGAKGDSLKFTDVYFGKSPISVSNATPGIWKYMGAPELNAGGALSAIALLAVCLLMRRQGGRVPPDWPRQNKLGSFAVPSAAPASKGSVHRYLVERTFPPGRSRASMPRRRKR